MVNDLNQPRFQQLMRTRFPDASPAAIQAIGLAATTQTEPDGRMSKVGLRCGVYGESSAFDMRLLDACVDEAKAAVKRAGGTL